VCVCVCVCGVCVCVCVCGVCVWCVVCVCVCVYVFHCGWHLFWKTKITFARYIYSRTRDIRNIMSKTLPHLPTLYPSVFNFPYNTPNPTPFPLAISAHFLTLLAGTLLIIPLPKKIYAYINIYIYIYIYVSTYIPLILTLFGSIINHETHSVNFLDARWC